MVGLFLRQGIKKKREKKTRSSHVAWIFLPPSQSSPSAGITGVSYKQTCTIRDVIPVLSSLPTYQILQIVSQTWDSGSFVIVSKSEHMLSVL
ncbi:hypothetical protein ACQP3L_33440, partial [Escherichia coli]